MQNKRVIGREVFLAYPDFNAPSEIHTDAIQTTYWCSHVSPKKSAFCSLNMNIAQQNYTTT